MDYVLPIALTQLVAFLLFLWVCNKYAVGPVLNLLDERRDKIAAQFDEIDSGKKRVATLKEDYEARGFAVGSLAGGMNLVSYLELIDLINSAEKVISWL